MFVSFRILRRISGAVLQLASRDPWLALVGLLTVAAGWLVREVEPWWTLADAGGTNAHQDLLWFASVFTAGRGLLLLDRAVLPWAAGSCEVRVLSACLALSLLSAAVMLAVCGLWTLFGLPPVPLVPCIARAAAIAAIAAACQSVLGRGATSWLAFAGLVWLLPGLFYRAPTEWKALGAAFDSRSIDARGAMARCLVWSGVAALASRAARYRRWR